ncbi:MAG: hypothetical protein AAGU27_23690 [Dehalobacterium sp.]
MKLGKLFGAMLCLIAVSAGVFMAGMMMGKSSSFAPPLTVLGDVGQVLTVRKMAEIGAPEKITLGGTSYKTVKLAELINKASPQGRVKKIFFVASDGFTSAIEAEGWDQSYISFSQKNGWIALNLHYPISANAKMIQEIVVVCDSGPAQNSFTLISGEKLLNYTVGQLYTEMLTSYPYFEGQATVEHEGITYASEVFTRRRVFRLGDLTSLDREAKVMLWGEKGEYQLADENGYFELCGNHINYIRPESREDLEMVRLAVINPPSVNITDTYYDALHYLKKGENVLVVTLGGLSYDTYQYAVKEGCAPFLTKNARVAASMGVYPLKANVWLAAMLTGLSPAENGVLNEHDHTLPVNTLFSKAKETGKKALLLEADHLFAVDILSTVRDDNGSGSTDDEIYARLLKSIDDGYGFIIARFDSIGSANMRFGKQSAQAEHAIAQIDSFLDEIASKWQGKIIVTAVPGENSGETVALSRESMCVPYFFLSGKDQRTGK